MGKAKRTRKFAAVKRRLNPKDERLKKDDERAALREARRREREQTLREQYVIADLFTIHPVTQNAIAYTLVQFVVASEGRTVVEQANSSMFFQYNTNLVPPYQVIVDTNFVNAALQIKTDLLKGLMDCLVAKCVPCVTDCVVGELEKLGHRYRLALALAKDRRFKRLTCCHEGTYADDCIVRRVVEHKCFIVATNDKDLKRRVRKIPGVPIIYVKNHKFAVERLPDAISSVPHVAK